MLFVDIETAIEHIANEVELLQPLFEALVNSIHSNSNNIDITIEDIDGFISSYSVMDDGDGYTPLNIKSFSQLWSNIKQEPGALGSGRLMYLRVFKYVNIESYTGTRKVDFKFDTNFDPSSIKPISNVSPKKTITVFHDLHDEYKDKKPFNLTAIKEEIFYELLPMFSRIWRDEKDITITINGVLWINKDKIEEEFQQVNLEHTDFLVSSTFSLLPERFDLYYNISDDDNGVIHQFYGAAGRRVKNFTSKVRIRKLPNNASGVFCLTGSYLDDRVRDDRRDFKIASNESNHSFANPISFSEINQELQVKINEIIFEKFPNYITEFELKKEIVLDQNPHLTDFIREVKNITYTEEEIVENAEKLMREEFDNTKKSLAKFKENIVQKRNFDEKAFERITKTFTKTGRDQLASYIAYRHTILDMLETIMDVTETDKNSFKEKSIHELYMPQGATSDDYAKLGTNMWIFDDKYMSYLYSASDKQIRQIREKFHQELEEMEEDVNDGDKPDLVLFFSDEEEDAEKDVLIVEFKKYDATYHEKIKAINQMEIYASVIEETIKNVRSVFAYTILEIDPKFRKYLQRTSPFTENSLGDKSKVSSYYFFNETVRAHLYIMSFDQVIADAKKRNLVFLDILRGAHTHH